VIGEIDRDNAAHLSRRLHLALALASPGRSRHDRDAGLRADDALPRLS
jgi:hypothetical protein